MSGADEWLPSLVLFDAYQGEWQRYVDAVYEQFHRDFIANPPVLRGMRVSYRWHTPMHEKANTFWHIVSGGKVERERLPDLRRCERIRWPRALIDAVGTERVVVWERTDRGERRVLIALSDYSYLVVLADRGAYLLLVTAYPVEGTHQRARLRGEWENYHQGRKS